jgi:uncharacterized membrane protein YtjA (UPF0391 family)
MLKWALFFLIIGLIAGALGFTTIFGVAMEIAKILFIIFIILFLVFLFIGWRGYKRLTRGPGPGPKV